MSFKLYLEDYENHIRKSFNAISRFIMTKIKEKFPAKGYTSLIFVKNNPKLKDMFLNVYELPSLPFLPDKIKIEIDFDPTLIGVSRRGYYYPDEDELIAKITSKSDKKYLPEVLEKLSTIFHELIHKHQKPDDTGYLVDPNTGQFAYITKQDIEKAKTQTKSQYFAGAKDIFKGPEATFRYLTFLREIDAYVKQFYLLSKKKRIPFTDLIKKHINERFQRFWNPETEPYDDSLETQMKNAEYIKNVIQPYKEKVFNIWMDYAKKIYPKLEVS